MCVIYLGGSRGVESHVLCLAVLYLAESRRVESQVFGSSLYLLKISLTALSEKETFS